jgi:hypothetical protein
VPWELQLLRLLLVSAQLLQGERVVRVSSQRVLRRIVSVSAQLVSAQLLQVLQGERVVQVSLQRVLRRIVSVSARLVSARLVSARLASARLALPPLELTENLGLRGMQELWGLPGAHLRVHLLVHLRVHLRVHCYLRKG